MYIDLFILILLAWAVFSGWRNGFLREVVSTLGIVSGLIVAGLVYMLPVRDYLAVEGSTTNMLLSVGAFFILWIVFPIVLGFVAGQLTRALRGMKLGLPNSLLGMAFSVTKFALLISCTLNMMSRLHILDEEKAATSRLYAPTVALLPFLESQTETAPTDADATGADTVWVTMPTQKANR